MVDKYHRAARDGYLDILRNGNRKEMNTPDEDGRTPTMLAAETGNVDALRMIIMRGGDPNRMDLLGNTAMHLAAKNGHMNCIMFLVNFGANVWALDNENQTSMEVAALENREDIVKFLDDTQNIQTQKNPKVVQSLKEKAMKEAERNAKYFEKMQEKASREAEKETRKLQKIQSDQNGDFNPPSESSFVKKLTLRIKGTNKLKNIKNNNNGTVSAFSDLVNGNSKSGTTRKIYQNGGTADTISGFRVSEFDDSGKRTIKSVKGTLVRKDAQVLYVRDQETTDTSARPALTNVFTGTSLDDKGWNRSRKDNLTDSGNDSFDSALADEDEAPGIFNRPNFGQIAFMNRMDHLNTFKAVDIPIDDIPQDEDGILGESKDQRNSSGTDSLGTIGSAGEESSALPWQPEDLESDDDDDENEYSPVIVFLESCGLTNYTKLFTDQKVDFEALMCLTNQDIMDMQLPIGPRRKLMDAIQRRRVVLKEPAQMYDSQL